MLHYSRNNLNRINSNSLSSSWKTNLPVWRVKLRLFEVLIIILKSQIKWSTKSPVLGMIVQQLFQDLSQIICSFWIEDIDSKKSHEFGADYHQDKAPDGTLKQFDHLNKLGTRNKPIEKLTTIHTWFKVAFKTSTSIFLLKYSPLSYPKKLNSIRYLQFWMWLKKKCDLPLT